MCDFTVEQMGGRKVFDPEPIGIEPAGDEFVGAASATCAIKAISPQDPRDRTSPAG